MSREFHLINTGKIRKLFRQILNICKNKKIFIKDNYVLAKYNTFYIIVVYKKQWRKDMDSIRLKARAKINLGLDVLGKEMMAIMKYA